ncbi:uncharacterized protein Dsimw501_GD27552 [Drosophila simulans]|nr:uncharacterized protein Dsimw501_GD27552 [Drosophila simulans]
MLHAAHLSTGPSHSAFAGDKFAYKSQLSDGCEDGALDGHSCRHTRENFWGNGAQESAEQQPNGRRDWSPAGCPSASTERCPVMRECKRSSDPLKGQ